MWDRSKGPPITGKARHWDLGHTPRFLSVGVTGRGHSGLDQTFPERRAVETVPWLGVGVELGTPHPTHLPGICGVDF